MPLRLSRNDSKPFAAWFTTLLFAMAAYWATSRFVLDRPVNTADLLLFVVIFGGGLALGIVSLRRLSRSNRPR